MATFFVSFFLTLLDVVIQTEKSLQPQPLRKDPVRLVCLCLFLVIVLLTAANYWILTDYFRQLRLSALRPFGGAHAPPG